MAKDWKGVRCADCVRQETSSRLLRIEQALGAFVTRSSDNVHSDRGKVVLIDLNRRIVEPADRSPERERDDVDLVDQDGALNRGEDEVVGRLACAAKDAVVTEGGGGSGTAETVRIGERADRAGDVRAYEAVLVSVTAWQRRGFMERRTVGSTVRDCQEDRLLSEIRVFERKAIPGALTRISIGPRGVEPIERISGKVVTERDLAARAKATSEDRVGIIDSFVNHHNLRARVRRRVSVAVFT